jgi:phenylalanyl-tRNA synthetase alpha chain
MIPPLLRTLAAAPPRDVLLVCPGLVYRRDSIDRLHTGEPHQVDLWRIASVETVALGPAHLATMIDTVVDALLPGWAHRRVPAAHPYTTDGVQIDVRTPDGRWVEVGECGLALPALLAECGLDPMRHRGLAMGLGLDRLLMLAKGIDDIRLLRATDPRIARQMLDLAPYVAVSSQPPMRRDLSLAVDAPLDAEALGDRVRELLGADASLLEEVLVLDRTPVDALPPAAAARMGARPGQTNVLVRLVIRDVARTLTTAEANALRNRVYAALHEGNRREWAE